MFKNTKILWWKFLRCSNHACKIREQNLTREYTLTRNKIAIFHILVEKLKNENIFEMLW